MAGFYSAKSNIPQQPYSSVLASGTLKRKRAGDESGALLTSSSQSEITKRQRYGVGCYETTVRGIEEGSGGSRSRRPRPLVRQSTHEHEREIVKFGFQRYEPDLNPNSITENRKSCSSHPWQEPPAQFSSVSADEAGLLEHPKKPRTSRKDTMTISNRKKHFIYTPDDSMKDMMKRYVYDVYGLFDDSRSEDHCWLHPSPPPARRNGRPTGTIQYTFIWKDSSGRHNLHVNFGVVALIIEHHLTEEQMEGYVKEAWHLSHLCGNWTCCNWRHMTLESGRINISRNKCFPDVTHCSHDPPCMKDRKRSLLVTLAISNEIRSAVESVRNCTKAALEYQNSTMTAAGFDCGICGRGVRCFGDNRICRSLTSITKSQEALEKLELCFQPNDEILKAIKYLKQIIVDLIREKEASDAVFLQRAVAQTEVDQSAHWSQKQFSSYGQMLAFLLD